MKKANENKKLWTKLHAAEGRIAAARLAVDRLERDETRIPGMNITVGELIAKYNAARSELNEAIASGKALYHDNVAVIGHTWAGYRVQEVLQIDAVRLYELMEDEAEPFIKTRLEVDREKYYEGIENGAIPARVIKEIETVTYKITSPKGAK